MLCAYNGILTRIWHRALYVYLYVRLRIWPCAVYLFLSFSLPSPPPPFRPLSPRREFGTCIPLRGLIIRYCPPVNRIYPRLPISTHVLGARRSIGSAGCMYTRQIATYVPSTCRYVASCVSVLSIALILRTNVNFRFRRRWNAKSINATFQTFVSYSSIIPVSRPFECGY